MPPLFPVHNNLPTYQLTFLSQSLNEIDTIAQCFDITVFQALTAHGVYPCDADDFVVAVFFYSSHLDIDKVLSIRGKGKVGFAVFVDGRQLVFELSDPCFVKIGRCIGVHFDDGFVLVDGVVTVEVVM